MMTSTKDQMSRRARVVAAVAVTVLSAAAISATHAVAAPSNSYVFQARNNDASTGSRLCLDADANATNGAVVHTVNCNGSTYQQWQLGTVNGRGVMINVGHPGYALASDSFNNGATALLRPVNGNVMQNWINPNTSGTGFSIYNASSNPRKVLDAVYGGGAARNGRTVQLNGYTGVSNQAWGATRIA